MRKILIGLLALLLAACGGEKAITSIDKVSFSAGDLEDPVMLEAMTLINEADMEQIEYSLRDKLNNDYAQRIAAYWQPEMTQDLTDQFANALMDYHGGKLDPLMIAALESPEANVQTVALYALTQDDKIWEDYYEGGWVQADKVTAAVLAYKEKAGLK